MNNNDDLKKHLRWNISGKYLTVLSTDEGDPVENEKWKICHFHNVTADPMIRSALLQWWSAM